MLIVIRNVFDRICGEDTAPVWNVGWVRYLSADWLCKKWYFRERALVESSKCLRISWSNRIGIISNDHGQSSTRSLRVHGFKVSGLQRSETRFTGAAHGSPKGRHHDGTGIWIPGRDRDPNGLICFRKKWTLKFPGLISRSRDWFLGLIPGPGSTFENRDPGFFMTSHLFYVKVPFFEKKANYTSKWSSLHNFLEKVFSR